MPRRYPEWEPSRETKETEKLEQLTGKTAERLREEGVPVDDWCRIKMEAFRHVYEPKIIEGDEKRVRDFKIKWYGERSGEEIKKEAFQKTGEQLEMLVVSVFNKFLGSELVAVRTAAYDDIRNKIDTLIVDKKSGSIICAFDEVGTSSGPRFEEKKGKILKKNQKGGGKIKYGLDFNEGKPELKPRNNIPLFYLALNKESLGRAMRELNPSLEKKSDFEEKLFDYFVSSLNSQSKELRLQRLNREVEDKLNSFETLIEDFTH